MASWAAAEGREWLTRMLAMGASGDETLIAARTRALNGASMLAYRHGDYAEAVRLSEESLVLSRTHDNRAEMAEALGNPGFIALVMPYCRATEAWNQTLSRCVGPARNVVPCTMRWRRVPPVKREMEKGTVVTTYRIGVVGGTGILGTELLRILEQRRFPIRTLNVYASDRSIGQRVPFGEGEVMVERPLPGAFKHLDLVFLAAGRETNAQVLPHARNAGCMVINVTGRENTSETTPLVIPEVNEEVLANGARIVACPHDLTIQLCLVLAPLHRLNPIRRVTVTALCAVGSAGSAAMRELTDETQAVLQGKEPVAHIFAHPIAFNLLPEVNVFHADGYSREEWLLAQETKQVLRAPELRLSATAVRAPVYQAHTQNVHAEFSRLLNADDARSVLSKSPGLRVQDDPVVSLYPHPVGVMGQDSVAVGRIREDSSNPYGLVFWSAMDHLRKGSALNAVQIAEALANRDTI